jgi:phytanoyl-CoA hydroxylase
MHVERIVAEYEENGFVPIHRFFAPEVVDRVRQALERYLRDVVPVLPTEDRVLETDGRTVRNCWRMHLHDSFFAELAGRADITSLVAELLHGEPVLMAVESFNKPARVGSAVPYHQDNAYFCQTPPDVLTVWVALDVANEANGAVRYVPGSHRRGLLPHKASLVAGNSIGLAEHPDPADTEEYCATLEPGDIVIHHSLTIHRSTPNTSNASRRGLLLVYRGSHTRTDPRLEAKYKAARAMVSGT